MTTTELPKFQSHFSESTFWSKLSAIAKKVGSNTVFYTLALYYLMKSPDVPIGNKAIIIGALGYLIFPADLVPDVIPVLGLTDDAAAIKLAYETVKTSITQDIKARAQRKTDELFRLN